MTTFDLRKLRLRSGDQARERVEIELEPLLLGGQSYEPQPNPAPAELKVTRASSGTVLELAFDVSLEGPCFRCLQDAELELQLRLREYAAAKPESDDERTEYLDDDRLDLSAWARDAIALALPGPDPLPSRLRRPLPRLRQGSQRRAARARGGETRPALGEAQRAAAAGMTNGVVVVIATKPRRSRIGRLVGSAST